jgi:integrin-linked kinase-associated serine/threonine phosphatase 2C
MFSPNDREQNGHLTPKGKVFGVPLEVVMCRSNQETIPTIVREMIMVLQRHGLSIDGIFRKSPLPEVVQEAKLVYDHDQETYGFEKLDPHVVAALLKLYLKELPEPLFPSKLYPVLMQAELAVEPIRQIIQSELPPCHRRLAEVLFVFLNVVLDFSNENKLTLDELAMIFGSIFLRPRNETPETLAEIPKRTLLTKFMLRNVDKIFPKIVGKRTLIKVTEPPELYVQRQKVNRLKVIIREALSFVSQQLIALHKDLETATNLEDIIEIAKTLKCLKESFETRKYFSSSSFVQSPREVSLIPQKISTSCVESGHFGLQGRRSTMEDYVVVIDNVNSTFELLSKNCNRSLYAVFDGHSGPEAAELASIHLHRDIILCPAFNEGNIFAAIRAGVEKTDQFILNKARELHFESGTTVAMALLIGEELYIANLGDTEIVLGQQTTDNGISEHSICPIVLTEKHKPDNDREKERILAAGGFVFRHRIFGKLAVSRSLGDSEYKMPKAKGDMVSWEPYLNKVSLTENDQFLIIACDGLWEKLSYQEAVDFVAEHRKQGKNAQEICKLLAQKAFDMGSLDNISVIIVFLLWSPPKKRQ